MSRCLASDLKYEGIVAHGISLIDVIVGREIRWPHHVAAPMGIAPM